VDAVIDRLLFGALCVACAASVYASYTVWELRP